jgi:hypothetical protein
LAMVEDFGPGLESVQANIAQLVEYWEEPCLKDTGWRVVEDGPRSPGCNWAV